MQRLKNVRVQLYSNTNGIKLDTNGAANSGTVQQLFPKRLAKEFGSFHDDEWSAMETLREKLTLPRVLLIHHAGEHNTLGVEACDRKRVCMHLQEQPKKPKKETIILAHLLQRQTMHTTKPIKNVSRSYGYYLYWDPTRKDVDSL